MVQPGTIPVGGIDAHQHFWHYNTNRHSWITDDMAVIRKDFLPADLEPLLKANGMNGCIAVQADQTEQENEFLLQLAAENEFIKGIVGWVDLRALNVQQRLEHYSHCSPVKGFRHILQGEDPSFMLQPDFLRGIKLLQQFNFTYDILVFPRHLRAVGELVRMFPQQRFVIDHIAKPLIKDGVTDEWKKDLSAMAACPNVQCKVSGMVTEANIRNWKTADFNPYLDAVTEIFGINRLMFGSDWPVCLAAGSYSEVTGIVKQYFSSFSAAEQQLIFSANAISFYHLI